MITINTNTITTKTITTPVTTKMKQAPTQSPAGMLRGSVHSVLTEAVVNATVKQFTPEKTPELVMQTTAGTITGVATSLMPAKPLASLKQAYKQPPVNALKQLLPAGKMISPGVLNRAAAGGFCGALGPVMSSKLSSLIQTQNQQFNTTAKPMIVTALSALIVSGLSTPVTNLVSGSTNATLKPAANIFSRKGLQTLYRGGCKNSVNMIFLTLLSECIQRHVPQGIEKVQTHDWKALQSGFFSTATSPESLKTLEKEDCLKEEFLSNRLFNPF